MNDFEKNMGRGLALTLVTFAAVGTSSPASAQSPGEDDAAAYLEVITVTARKRDEQLVDVPISVSAFSAGEIQDKLIEDIQEISDFTPGFQQQAAFGRDGDRPVIRGASNIQNAEGKVGFFIDGAPIIGDTSGLDLTNLQQVEVIKGPQSAVFGRGTLSGAVNFITRRPADEPVLDFRVNVGNYDRVEATGAWSGALGRGLSAVITASRREFGGDFDNNEDGGSLNERETTAASAFLYYEPNDRLTASLKYIYQEVDDGQFAIELLDSSFNNVFLESRGYIQGVIPVPADSEFGLNTDDVLRPGLKRETHQIIADVAYEFDSGMTLSYLGSFASQEEVFGYDQTNENNNAFFLPSFVCENFVPNATCTNSAFNDTDGSDRDAFSHELRLTSRQDARIRGSIGYFFFDDRLEDDTRFLESTEVGLDFLDDRLETENHALFASIEGDVSERLTLGLEVRYNRDKVEQLSFSYIAGDQFDPAFFDTVSSPDPNAVVGTDQVREATFNRILPRVTMRYAFNDDLNGYAQYSEGNAPGGFNELDAPDTTFEEEELRNFEVGLKGRLPNANLRFSLAAFHNVFDNQTFSEVFVTQQGGLGTFNANIGETEINGFEFSGDWAVTDTFSVNGTLAFIDAEITEGTNADQGILLGGISCLTGVGGSFDPRLPGCEALSSVVGKRPPLVSDWQATLSPRYSVPLAGGNQFFAGADVIFRSSFYTQVHNLLETGDSTRVNVQAGMEIGDRYKITVWGENVTDEDAPIGIIRFVDFQAPAVPESGLRPRGFGFTPTPKPAYGVMFSASF